MITSLHPYDLFIVLFLTFGLVTVLVNYFTVRRFDEYPTAEKFPRVSILVPARNEAANIEACVVSLLAQDYPDFEVIILDDQSTDETPNILSLLKQANDHLTILSGTPRPEGWLGKHWACHQLAQTATGEVILFTDADTRHTPDMLRDSVSALVAESADLVTAFPREEVITWGERLLVPVIGWGIFTFIPIRLVQKMRLTALSITIGQFMLFRRNAYDAIGGYEAVRNELVDDVSLGRNIISSGLEWRFLDGTHHVTCRMYRNFWDAVGGFQQEPVRSIRLPHPALFCRLDGRRHGIHCASCGTHLPLAATPGNIHAGRLRGHIRGDFHTALYDRLPAFQIPGLPGFLLSAQPGAFYQRGHTVVFPDRHRDKHLERPIVGPGGDEVVVGRQMN